MSWEKDHFAGVFRENRLPENVARDRLAELISDRDCTNHKEVSRHNRYVYGDTSVYCKCGRVAWASEATRGDDYWTLETDKEERRDGEIAALEEYLEELCGNFVI